MQKYITNRQDNFLNNLNENYLSDLLLYGAEFTNTQAAHGKYEKEFKRREQFIVEKDIIERFIKYAQLSERIPVSGTDQFKNIGLELEPGDVKTYQLDAVAGEPMETLKYISSKVFREKYLQIFERKILNVLKDITELFIYKRPVEPEVPKEATGGKKKKVEPIKTPEQLKYEEDMAQFLAAGKYSYLGLKNRIEINSDDEYIKEIEKVFDDIYLIQKHFSYTARDGEISAILDILANIGGDINPQKPPMFLKDTISKFVAKKEQHKNLFKGMLNRIDLAYRKFLSDNDLNKKVLLKSITSSYLTFVSKQKDLSSLKHTQKFRDDQDAKFQLKREFVRTYILSGVSGPTMTSFINKFFSKMFIDLGAARFQKNELLSTINFSDPEEIDYQKFVIAILETFQEHIMPKLDFKGKARENYLNPNTTLNTLTSIKFRNAILNTIVLYVHNFVRMEPIFEIKSLDDLGAYLYLILVQDPRAWVSMMEPSNIRKAKNREYNYMEMPDDDNEHDQYLNFLRTESLKLATETHSAISGNSEHFKQSEDPQLMIRVLETKMDLLRNIGGTEFHLLKDVPKYRNSSITISYSQIELLYKRLNGDDKRNTKLKELIESNTKYDRQEALKNPNPDTNTFHDSPKYLDYLKFMKNTLKTPIGIFNRASGKGLLPYVPIGFVYLDLVESATRAASVADGNVYALGKVYTIVRKKIHKEKYVGSFQDNDIIYQGVNNESDFSFEYGIISFLIKIRDYVAARLKLSLGTSQDNEKLTTYIVRTLEIMFRLNYDNINSVTSLDELADKVVTVLTADFFYKTTSDAETYKLIENTISLATQPVKKTDDINNYQDLENKFFTDPIKDDINDKKSFSEATQKLHKKINTLFDKLNSKKFENDKDAILQTYYNKKLSEKKIELISKNIKRFTNTEDFSSFCDYIFEFIGNDLIKAIVKGTVSDELFSSKKLTMPSITFSKSLGDINVEEQNFFYYNLIMLLAEMIEFIEFPLPIHSSITMSDPFSLVRYVLNDHPGRDFIMVKLSNNQIKTMVNKNKLKNAKKTLTNIVADIKNKKNSK